MDNEQKFDYIILEIEKGNSLRQAIRSLKEVHSIGLSAATFYQWIDEDKIKQTRYIRATEERAEAMFDSIIEISDSANADLIEVDGKLIVNGEAVQRSRVKIDARKWALSKMFPKKYGDKLDVTSGGEKINVPIISFDPFTEDESDNSTS